MEATSTTRSPSTRMKMGAAILAASHGLDVTAIAIRLRAFADAHASYAEAQRRVGDLEMRARAGSAKLQAHQQAAIDGLATALVVEGHPRHFPFQAFGAPPPWKIKRLAFAKKARELRRLAAAVAQATVAPALLAAARAAEQAAEITEIALHDTEVLQSQLRGARITRNTIGHRWETALGALRRATHAATDESPGLYLALFGPETRGKRRARAKRGMDTQIIA